MVIPKHYYQAIRYFLFTKQINYQYLYSIINQTGGQSESGKKHVHLATIKQRAVKSGIPFNIKPKDIEWPTHCPILGVELKRGGDRRYSPSVDRINPELGYVKGNVRVISKLANAMKQNATREELELFVKNILPYMDGEI